MNALTERAKVGKVVRTRELLEELRIDMMKSYPLGKKIKLADYKGPGQLSAQSFPWLIELGVIEDKTPEGESNRDGRLLNWIYSRTNNGVVDSWIVDKLIQKERDYQKSWRDQKREGSLQILSTTIKSNSSMTKLPTSKEDKMEQVLNWLQDKIQKNEQIPGYLRADEAIMYTKIVEVFQGISELKEAIKKII